jgi:flagellar biosynthesis anti-sigma factor FlgM
MRVDLNGGSAIAESASQKSTQSRSHAATGANNNSSTHEAGATSLAAAALHAPEVRTAKVEGLRTQIAAGNYHVSAHQIAASIVDQLRTRPNRG